jgi:hypothetical protein
VAGKFVIGRLGGRRLVEEVSASIFAFRISIDNLMAFSNHQSRRRAGLVAVVELI